MYYIYIYYAYYIYFYVYIGTYVHIYVYICIIYVCIYIYIFICICKLNKFYVYKFTSKCHSQTTPYYIYTYQKHIYQKISIFSISMGLQKTTLVVLMCFWLLIFSLCQYTYASFKWNVLRFYLCTYKYYINIIYIIYIIHYTLYMLYIYTCLHFDIYVAGYCCMFLSRVFIFV